MKIDFSKVVALDHFVRQAQEEAARQWRNEELARADIQLSKVQDGATGIGTQKAWREYRNVLRDWPASNTFPASKPLAPDTE